MLVKTCGPDDLKPEPLYNTTAVRLFPWAELPEPEWGGAWVAVEPGQTITPHSHDDREMFLVVEGVGRMRVGTETREVGFGDTIFITPGVDHDLTNTSTGRLLFIGIWWGGVDVAVPAAGAER